MKYIFKILVIILLSVFVFKCSPITPLISNKNTEALEFCKENNFNTDFYIWINMNIHSGKNRLFIYDLKKDSVISSGLCSHGCGESLWASDQTKENPSFSNIIDSHQSSIGKYKIGDRGYSNWGIHVNYKLHGLESTNSNALQRFIVLHSWNSIGNEEVYPNGTPEGWGCPAVSSELMLEIDGLLQKSDKPVLLWIYKDK